ncbi:MAG TPA: transglycosylase domain-containing protein, partial [Hyphomicrobiaceae bacterium]|nr:transglycosylase domain-containing protein [Hyphomicrobiaceae bacterium]
MGLFRRRKDAKPIAEPVLSQPQNGPAPPVQVRPDQGKSRRPSFALKLAAYTTLSVALGCALWLGAMMVYYTIVFPDPLAVRGKETAPIIRILARDGTLLARRGAAHDYMPIDMIPKRVLDAVVATEDRRFFSHWGIDPAGLVRASFANLRAGRFVQGGSTLTQQLAKNLFLTSERTLSRKLDELALAFWLEVRLSKREILELYLNRVYFGGGAYGIEAAAQRYFDKSVRALSVAEAALIAGLLKAPSKYAPTTNSRAAIARAHSILAKMEAAGFIDHATYRRARLKRFQFANFKALRGTTGFEYAIDMVLEKLPPILGTEYSEMIVETTIDAALQKHANTALAALLDGKGKAMGAHQAALVSLDSDGAIRVLIGGRSYAESQFNRATKAHRQPGSAFKPFVYLTALERGMKPDTITYDLPLTIDGWSPRNDNNANVGALTLRQALAQSVNTVAVRLAKDAGLSAVAATARRLGVQSELRQDASMALGTSEVTLLELVGAYGAFADGGIQVEPYIIRRVRLNTGRVLYARGAEPRRRVIALAEVGALNDMLNSALVAGTGRRAALPRHPA